MCGRLAAFAASKRPSQGNHLFLLLDFFSEMREKREDETHSKRAFRTSSYVKQMALGFQTNQQTHEQTKFWSEKRILFFSKKVNNSSSAM
jgi:hypothetical protein